MAIGLSSMIGGVITVVSSFVGRDLGMTNAEITWLSAAPSLAAGSFLLFFGKLADLFGRRSMFIGSLGLFSVLALGAGFARKPIQLDVICGFVGLMTAGAVPSAQGMLGSIYEKPSRRKNAAFACFSSGNPLGYVFGMLSGGIASQIFSWRAAFWFLALTYFLFTIVAVFTIPKDEAPMQKLDKETVKRFDLLGVFLTIAGTGSFSAALSLGSDAPHGWKTSYVLALLIIGFVLMVGFVLWEIYYDTPLISMTIFRDRNFSLLLAILLLGFLAFNATAFWLSLYFQRVYHASSIMTAVYLLPMAVAGTMVNIVAGAVLHRVSNKLLMGIATSSYVVAYLLFALNKTSWPYWACLFTGQIFMVVGVDLQFNVVNM
jgi:MFS family permease